MDFTFPLDYDDIQKELDKGRMPVIVFLDDNLIYACSYTIKSHGPVLAEDDDERLRAVAKIAVWTTRFARKTWEKHHGAG